MKRIYFYRTPRKQKNFDDAICALDSAGILFDFGMRGDALCVDDADYEKAVAAIQVAGIELNRDIFVG